MRKYNLIAVGLIIGAAAGYGYYYFVGCSNGSCPMTSKWYVTTLYGAVAGAVLALPSRKKKNKTAENEKDGNK